jgi:glutamate-ammonia-ligase adenylyltransferase
MGYPPGSASRLEDDYLRVTRRARHVFEERFYGAAG